MAISGFEGYEKRLELRFSGDTPPPVKTNTGGLRQLDFESIERVLHKVQCTVVSALANQYFDSYVLSESSLFVYPTKIIIKTCGTTQLLRSVRPFIHLASTIGLTLCACRYTRGNFIFPKAQPFPHTSFKEEVIYLEENLPSHLCFRKACVMPSKLPSHSWHVFSACNYDQMGRDDEFFTVEVCMTELDRVLARKFFKNGGGGTSGKEMTDITGIRGINRNALICDYGFDPCGYSMNGLDGECYSTIHVTPEDGFSYASFECIVSKYDNKNEILEALKKVVQVFRPGNMSVSTTGINNDQIWKRVGNAIESIGMKCRSCSVDEFPTAGTVAFQTFSTRRKI